MRKIWNIVFVAFAAAAFTVACTKASELDVTKEEVPQGEQKEGHQARPMTITATIPADIATKVTFTPDVASGKPNEMALTWTGDETLMVYDHNDDSKYAEFLFQDGVGTASATFYCNDASALDGAESYDVVILDNKTVVDYNDQTQLDDGDTSHLRYIAGKNNITDLKTIEFDVASSILAITVQMSDADIANDITSVDITASAANANDAKIFNGNNTLSITLQTNATDDKILNLYATLPVGATIAEGVSLIVRLNSSNPDHTVYTRYIELASGSFAAGELNTININATQSDTHAGKTSCDGSSAENAYLIGDKYQLLAVEGLMKAGETKYFKLLNDIDMYGEEWTLLNKPSPFDKLIDFDGNNKTISNLGGSMFYVFKGAVRNLTLDSPSVTAGTHKGVFATYIQGTNNTLTKVKIQNVASFEGSSGNCGGMVGRINSGADGYPTATFDGCVVSNVPVNSGGTSAGGFIGSVEAKVVMNNCTYTGANVTNTSKSSDKGYAGGLIGFASAEVSITSSRVVNAKIAGYDAIGGMIGNINSGGFGNLTSCSVKADVNGRNYIGGLIGRERIASGVAIAISKCSFESYEDGVSGTNQYVGGIIGNQYGSGTVTIENSYVNSPVIAADAWAGGISSNHYNGTLTIGRCYVMGSVSAKYGAGGIVGQVRVANLTINPCAVYVSSISATATDSDPHESSGTIVAYGYNVNVTIARNCWYDQTLSFTECPGNAGSPSTWTPTKQGGLTNAKISGGTPHSKIYPYWGRNTNPSDYPLNKMCKDILECSSDIWNLDVNPPILK